MVRPSSAAKKKQSEAETARADPVAEERRRLRDLALSHKLLSRTPAKPSAPLEPSKTVLRHQGKDIVKKGQRKNRFLFSFPGLLAPLSGGRIGELSDLGTKNPKMYLDFPQGRMKLFGTIVYPRNKYLTLQFGRTSKSVMCEDSFENMVKVLSLSLFFFYQ
ncbi:DNA-binding protein RHL1 [Acorus calamus]|uniref:DNA-binding protein RHL1 n=1 Tax=Acorus calamus TaxID=4465 RepID=A0AAV9FH05_ACOCL|nr:DNA-binding protein RHL1 [Acorus calamus]